MPDWTKSMDQSFEYYTVEPTTLADVSLGVVKWYKAGNTTAVATAKTYTITATDVDNMLAITAQLEQ